MVGSYALIWFLFRGALPLELKKLADIFRHKVILMLLAKGKIPKETIAIISNWRHSEFNVFCGNRISPNDATAMENLARLPLGCLYPLLKWERGEWYAPIMDENDRCHGQHRRQMPHEPLP
jgi:hypothetical protein